MSWFKRKTQPASDPTLAGIYPGIWRDLGLVKLLLSGGDIEKSLVRRLATILGLIIGDAFEITKTVRLGKTDFKVPHGALDVGEDTGNYELLDYYIEPRGDYEGQFLHIYLPDLPPADGIPQPVVDPLPRMLHPALTYKFVYRLTEKGQAECRMLIVDKERKELIGQRQELNGRIKILQDEMNQLLLANPDAKEKGDEGEVLAEQFDIRTQG